MTDPSPQAVTCLHCGKTVSEGIERDCYGSKTGMHNWVEPAEPSPAPPAEREWLVVDSMPEAMKILADKLKQAESALTAAREERDRAQAALRELDRYVRLGRGAIELGITEDGNIGIWLANEEKTVCKGDTVADAIAALKPVSDRQPEGETHKVPDRVIDAPIPEDLKDRRALLQKWIYGPVTEHDPMPHESSLRNELALIERIARLEAERQDARTEGWNAAIEEAADTLETTSALYAKRVRALSKPTAAKQGDSA